MVDFEPRVRLLLVVAVVAIAGCASGTGGTANTDDTGSTVPEVPLNGTAIAETHTERLQAADNYTLGLTSVQASGPVRNRINVTQLVDRDSQRGFVSYQRTTTIPGRPDVTTKTYTADNRTYLKVVQSLGNQTRTQYRTATAPYDDTRVQPVNLSSKQSGKTITAVVDALAWERTGPTRTDGVETVQYNATGIDNATAFERGFGVSAANASAVNATLEMTREGLVRRLVFSFRSNTSQGSSTLRTELHIRKVGTTSLSEPAWVETARNETA